MLSLDLRSCSPIRLISTPSITIFPSDGSTTLNRDWMSVDLPLPVLPTTPTLFPPGKLQLTPFKIMGRAGPYRTWRLWSSMVPDVGQPCSGLQSSITRGASLGMPENRRILSTEIILFSTLQRFHITHACSTLRFNPYVAASPARPGTESQVSHDGIHHCDRNDREELTWIDGIPRHGD